MLIYIPVILVTGHASENVRGESFDTGVTVFYSKPFDIIDFRNMANEILPS